MPPKKTKAAELPPRTGPFRVRMIISDRRYVKSKASGATHLRHTVTFEIWPGEWLAVIGALVARSLETGKLSWYPPATMRGRSIFTNVVASPGIPARIIAWVEAATDHEGKFIADKIGAKWELPPVPDDEESFDMKREIEI